MNMERLGLMMLGEFKQSVSKNWMLQPMDTDRPDDWSLGFKLTKALTGMVIHVKLWLHPEGKILITGEYPRDEDGRYDIATNYTLKHTPPRKEMKVTEASVPKVVQFVVRQFYPMYEAAYAEAMEIKERDQRANDEELETVRHLTKMIRGEVRERDKFERIEDKWSVQGRVDGDRVVLKLDVPSVVASELLVVLRDHLAPDEFVKRFGEVSWCAEDVIMKLEENDIPATDENVDLVIDRCRKINESMVEQGWLYIDIVISDLESDKSFNMEGEEDGAVRESTEQVV